MDNRPNAQKYYYMLVTKDKYRLPLIVCDTAQELADIVGVSVKAIYKEIERENKGLYQAKFIRVLRG